MSFDDLIELFSNLKNETDKKKKATDLRRQRHKFREFIKTMEGMWIPEVIIKLRGLDADMKGWGRWIEYHRIKEVMGGGFQTHLLENDRLRAMFDMSSSGFVPKSLSKV